jgi:hypothetical protein
VASLWFLIALAFISLVSACYRYVNGRRSVLAPFYLPGIPSILYRAYRKYDHFHRPSHNAANCWVCQDPGQNQDQREATLTTPKPTGSSPGPSPSPAQSRSASPSPAPPSASPTPARTVPRAVVAIRAATSDDLQGRYLAARINLDPDRALLASLAGSMGTQDYQAVERFFQSQGSTEAVRYGKQIHNRLLTALETGNADELAAAVSPWDKAR